MGYEGFSLQCDSCKREYTVMSQETDALPKRCPFCGEITTALDEIEETEMPQGDEL